MSGHYEKKEKKKGKGSIVLKVLFILLAVIILLVAAVYIYWRSMLSKVNYVQMPERTESTAVTTEATEEDTQAAETTEETTVETTRPAMTADDIINILVVGQSSREGESARMADSMILVSLNTYTDTVTLTSIFRDTWADFPAYAGHGTGRNKITNCYALGYAWTSGDENTKIAAAMDMMNQCLELNFGIEVDYDVEIDFEQFINMIDYVGGVEIELTEAEADYLNEDTLYVKTPVTAGVNRLDGMTALSYARMRHADGDNESDIKRTARQRRLINALIEQFRYASILDLQSLLSDCILPFITTNMDADTITSLTLKCLPLLADLTVESGTCPYEGSYWGEMVDIYGDGQEHSVVKFDKSANVSHMRAITEGETEAD